MLLNIVNINVHANAPVSYIRCMGLLPEKMYKVQETGKMFSGAALMTVGFPVPVVMGEYNAWQYHFICV